MKVSMDKLIKLLEQYGVDYLGYGTKDDIISELKEGNKELARDVLKALNDEWISRLKETKKFYIFEEARTFDFKGNLILNPFYEIGYMDHLFNHETKIPKLCYVAPKDFSLYGKTLARRQKLLPEAYVSAPNKENKIIGNCEEER